MVAAGVGDVQFALKNVKNSLFAPEDHQALAECVREHLRCPRTAPAVPIQTWRSRADDVGAFFKQIVNA